MQKRKKMTAIMIAESVLLVLFIAAAVLVAVFLRPVSFTASDGSTVNGWSWAGRVYIDANAFTNGMDVALDTEGRTIIYTQPVDPEQLRADTEEAMTLLFTAEAEETRQAYEDAVADLEAQLAESEETIAELQARIEELEQPASTGTSTAGGGSGAGVGSGSSGGGSSGGGSGTQAPSTTTPAAPTPDPTPAAPPPAAPAAPAVDAAACIAEARAYALSLGMTENTGIVIVGAGYLNPPDITVLTQQNVIDSLKYCLNQYLSYSPDNPALVQFHIVQSGNLIYALYQ